MTSIAGGVSARYNSENGRLTAGERDVGGAMAGNDRHTVLSRGKGEIGCGRSEATTSNGWLNIEGCIIDVNVEGFRVTRFAVQDLTVLPWASFHGMTIWCF